MLTPHCLHLSMEEMSPGSRHGQTGTQDLLSGILGFGIGGWGVGTNGVISSGDEA